VRLGPHVISPVYLFFASLRIPDFWSADGVPLDQDGDKFKVWSAPLRPLS
jgi:hypothetical protein